MVGIKVLKTSNIVSGGLEGSNFELIGTKLKYT